MYKFKTKPFAHQLKEFNDHKDTQSRALFWEQGTGKTKPIIDITGYQYLKGNINALVVVAPNGVHRNWVSDELPAHMPDDIQKQMRCHIWYSKNTKKHQAAFERVLAHDGLAVLVISYDAVRTVSGCDAWKRFLKTRECMYVLDESQYIKSPNAKITKRIMASIGWAKMKREASGTPVANSPFDIYSQLKFLYPDVWRTYGISNFSVFKNFFGIWTSISTSNGTFSKCVAYRNMDRLQKEMKTLGSRLTKDEVLDLPPKLYSKRYIQLTPKQKSLYQQLKTEFEIEIRQGVFLTAELAIVRLLRFQQIICGYLPQEDQSAVLVPIEGSNPRLIELGKVCEDLPHKAIIWARFKKDIELIMEHKTFKGKCVKVDGSVTGEARGEALDSFQKGEIQFLIANPAAISTGVTLTKARTVIYYSNNFNYAQRVQSEDRAHRIGQEHPVNYIDFVAEGTVDEHIVKSQRLKYDIACHLTGDDLKEWI